MTVVRYSVNALRELIAKGLTNPDEIGNVQAAAKFAEAIDELWNTDGPEYELADEDLAAVFGHVAEVFAKLADEMLDAVDSRT